MQVCHRKIDPLGFALENFDSIGRWREEYPKPTGKAPAAKLDPSGKLLSGEAYVDFADFKNALLASRRDRFARNLTEKLLAYATGRHMTPVDQYEIDDILERVKVQDYGLRTMVIAVLTSEIVRSR